VTSPTEERTYWTALAEADPFRAAWGADAIGTPRFDANRDHALEMIVPHLGRGIRPGGWVLDLGCGPGRLAVPIAGFCPRATIVGVDISARMIRAARNYAVDWSVGNCTWLISDGRRLPDIGPIDGAYSVLCFQHLDAETIRGYMQSFAGVLEPGAKLVIQIVRDDGIGFVPFDHHHGQSVLVDAELRLALVAVQTDPAFEQWDWLVFEAGDW
jgi:SAM-dependent methyltransferase